MIKVDYVVNSIFSSRTYFLSSAASSEVWLVDCGDFDSIKEYVGDRNIAGVLLTHTHFDHIYGLPELLVRFPSCAVVTNTWGVGALSNPRLNLSRYHESPVLVSPANVVVCGEGDSVPILNDGLVRVYEMPGHDPSCLVYEIEDNLFSGDVYIPGEKAVAKFPNSDMKMMILSRERILKLAESSGRVICPGH